MTRKVVKWFIFAGFVSLFSVCALAQAPQIFFTDLTSGPNSGGENGKGVYVTIYGNNFGATQATSSVSLNGSTSALSVVSWGTTWLWYQKIVVQLSTTAMTGNLQVTTGAGASNTALFTVRSGQIYCVSTTGSDSNAGTFSKGCWKTLLHARDSIAAGDTVYALNGVSQTVDDGQGWRTVMLLRNGGTSGNPMALVAYPGATVTIGNSSTPDYGIRSTSISNWVFAGLKLTGHYSGFESIANDFRIVGNDFTCPNGDTPDACAEATSGGPIQFYGNHVHDVGKSGATKQYHAVYFSSDTNHVDAGWNSIHDVQGCRGIQFHSSPVGSGTGYNQYDLHVHDSLIYNVRCDGINFATVDPSKGVVEAYNNVIYHVGAGPDPSDGGSNYSCIYSADITNSGAAGSGTIDVYNNSMYDCGSAGSGSSSHGVVNKDGRNTNLSIRLRNNIAQQLTSEGNYLQSASGGGLNQINGSNNIWYGSSASAPTQTTANITSDPKYVSTGTKDFALQSASPAIDVGVSIASLNTDHNGISRPQGSASDRGAYEYAQGEGSAPAPPTGLVVIVH